MKMSVEAIIIKERKRKINESKVSELVESIKTSGLLNPITVTKNNVLVAGNHRLEACKKLGHKEIEVHVIEAEGLMLELAEIDENLIRNELHYIDRGNHLARRKEIYEELYPETKKGAVNQYTKEVLKTDSDFSKKSFIADTAQKTGKSKTVIKEEIQIVRDTLPEVQQVIKEKDLPKTDALKVSRMKTEEQKQILGKIQNQNKPNINKAIEEIQSQKEQKKKCTICGANRPLDQFTKGEARCRDCNSFIKTAAKQGKKIDIQALKAIDVDLEALYNEAKCEKPSEEGNTHKTNVDPIISELIGILNSFHTNINKFAFMPDIKDFSDLDYLKRLLDWVQVDINKIQNNIGGKNHDEQN